MGFSNLYSYVLSHPSPLLRRFIGLLALMDHHRMQLLVKRSAILTRHHFGKTMRMFAPIYLPSECINSCAYCGFVRENAILRTTLEIDEVAREARHLAAQGFRNLLLVAGEHPKFVSHKYLERYIRLLATEIPSISLEVAPMEISEYQKMTHAGAEGLVLYQEMYHQPSYAQVHRFGPKRTLSGG